MCNFQLIVLQGRKLSHCHALIKQWILLVESCQELFVKLDCQKWHFGLCHGNWHVVMTVKPRAEDHMLTNILCLHLAKSSYQHLGESSAEVLDLHEFA